ncbi:MAG: hypothetical protein KatS3mg033_1871 [Thermonema sp.]|uniref:ArnT family glycosyltransferase n=1 Tax=Thermonema sp. TaxID=2231181 RepID=UPI0021DEAADF|nr:glycosyltransferase family 39 protein [Thermonema sp.]GIV40071.1 MAG: hypothetical protein KatS3mg033_1871 [Thermonema sp.]
MFSKTQRRYVWWLLLPLLVYVVGMPMDLMDVDAAQYAAISWEMLAHDLFLQITYKGSDYLDKPPLLFWTSIVAFKLFGISNWSYRLIPVLVSLIGVYSLYRFARLYYTKQVAYWAALLWASCQASILMNHDIRTDTMLTAWVTFAIWQTAAYLRHPEWRSLTGIGIGVGLAMLAKGPIGLVAPALSLGFDLIWRKEWKQFFRPAWLYVMVIVAIILLPMSIGLYEQFDAHPEKGVSGLRFYYWTQSFGRITGENPWRNDAGLFFFVHSFFWSFLPWSLLAVVAYVLESRRVWRYRFRKLKRQEFIAWGGFTLVFIAFSLSKFKLPHYTFVVFPLIALITAKWVVILGRALKWQKVVIRLRYTQRFIELLLLLLLLTMLLWIFPLHSWWGWACVAAGIALYVLSYRYATLPHEKVLIPSFVAICVVNIFLNAHVYPALLRYQAPSIVGRYLRQNKLQNNTYALLSFYHPSLEFYAQYIVPDLKDSIEVRLEKMDIQDAAQKKVMEKEAGKSFLQSFTKTRTADFYLYVDASYKELLDEMGISYEIVMELERFPVTELTLPFLNPATRKQQVSKQYLLKIKRVNAGDETKRQ